MTSQPSANGAADHVISATANDTTYTEEAPTPNSSENRETSSPSAPTAIALPPTVETLNKRYKDTFGPIIRMLEKGQMTPRQVSDSRNLVAASLAWMRFRYGNLNAKRARWVDYYKGRFKSMAETERAWEATDEGQEELILRNQVTALDGLQSALETNWFLLQGEAKSNY